MAAARIDDAVRRVLRLKFQLGLFEHPFVDPDRAQAIVGQRAFRAEAGAAQDRAIRIGFPSVAFQELPLFAASKRGFFHAEGLNVELVQIAGAPAVAALLSGDVDYITHNSRIVATAVRGGGVKSVFNYVAKPIYYLVTLPEIKQPKELQGRTVGVSGLPSDPAFLKAIVEHDGGEDQPDRQRDHQPAEGDLLEVTERRPGRGATARGEDDGDGVVVEPSGGEEQRGGRARQYSSSRGRQNSIAEATRAIPATCVARTTRRP